MPKSKYAPALFEVIRSRQETRAGGILPLPRWWRSGPRPAQPSAPQAPAAAPQPSGSEPPSSTAPTAAATTSEAPAATQPATPGITLGDRPTTAFGGEAEAWTGRPWRLTGDRLEIRLRPMVVVVVLGALVVSWVVAYQLGRGTRPASPVAAGGQEVISDPLHEAMLRPPDPTVLNVPGPPRSRERAAVEPRATSEAKAPAGQVGGETTGGAGAAAAGEPVGGRGEPATANLNRVLIETFKPEHKAAAEHVQRWLETNYSVRTELIRKSRGEWWLATVDGFDFSHPGDKELCEKFISDIKSLGPECARELSRAGLPVYKLTGPYAFR